MKSVRVDEKLVEADERYVCLLYAIILCAVRAGLDCHKTSSLILAPVRAHSGQGRIQTKVEGGGGNLERGAKTQWKVSALKARENFLAVIRENSLVFLLNNALVYKFRRIQNESLIKECIWVRIKGAFLAKKGGAKAQFSS